MKDHVVIKVRHLNGETHNIAVLKETPLSDFRHALAVGGYDLNSLIEEQLKARRAKEHAAAVDRAVEKAMRDYEAFINPNRFQRHWKTISKGIAWLVLGAATVIVGGFLIQFWQAWLICLVLWAVFKLSE